MIARFIPGVIRVALPALTIGIAMIADCLLMPGHGNSFIPETSYQAIYSSSAMRKQCMRVVNFDVVSICSALGILVLAVSLAVDIAFSPILTYDCRVVIVWFMSSPRE